MAAGIKLTDTSDGTEWEIVGNLDREQLKAFK